MGADYKALLYYCEARWLSRAKVLQRVFELKDELSIFLRDNNVAEANFFYDSTFLAKFAYLVDIFQKLSTLNKSMQGPQIHALTQKEKVTAFIKKLDLWITNVKSRNFEMFPNFKVACLGNQIDDIKVTINNHLIGLKKQRSILPIWIRLSMNG